MVKALSLLAVASVAGAETVKLSYTDCGSDSTHAKITGLKPETIDVPGKATIVGSGNLDADQTSASFQLKVKKAGIPLVSGKGSICEDTTIKIPLGAGSFTVKGIDCPAKAGEVDVEVDLDILSDLIDDGENSLLSIHIEANADDTGDQVICLDVDASLASASPAVPYKEPPQGLLIKNATALKEELERNAQFEKEFLEGNGYKSSLEVSYSMTNCNQECSNWCWATSATMCASAFGGGSSCEANEEKVAGHEFGLSCDSSCSSSCNKGGTTDEIADGIKYLSGHSYSAGGVLSQSSLDSALQHGPVTLAVYWTPGSGGHAIVINGVSGGTYKGHDPEGYSINTGYSGLTTYEPPYASGSYVGKWGGSVYTNSGADLVV
jgi:hypothetical protein